MLYDELIRWAALTGVGMMRPLGVMLILPLLGTGMTGAVMIRNTLALLAAFPSLPLLAGLSLPDPVTMPGSYIFLVATELVTGILLGFSAAIPFWALDMTGFIIDTMRGSSMAGIFNPLLSAETSPLGLFFSQIAGALFMFLGGFNHLLMVIFTSYERLEPGAALRTGDGFILLLNLMWHQLFTLALSFAMPAVVIMLLVDISLGLINRSAQQINVFTLSMPVKSAAVIFILILAIPFSLSGLLSNFSRFDGGLILQVYPLYE